ncbi:MAG: hypothetical protein K2V71_10535 [Methylotenera sp.]|nr:hypothetical protein [Methylotenera sp.]
MKLFRTIAIFLILALTTSPALAAHCATSFASESLMTAMHSEGDMSGMMHCQDSAMKKNQSKSSAEHKPCAMGVGCHFAQATPVDSFSKYVFIDSAQQSFPRFTPSEKSIDLSPPLKPPA